MIWHRFMVAPLGNTPPIDFPQPSTQPAWRASFQRGHHGSGYAATATTASPPPAASTAATRTTTSGPPAAPVSTG